MKNRLITILKYSFFLGLGIFLVWWSIHKMSHKEYHDFISSLRSANYFLLVPVFFVLVASHISRAMRWRILIKSLGYQPKLSNTFCAVMVGYLANFVFPRLGEVLKCTILSKYEKVPADKLIGTILVERAVDVVSFIIVIIVSLLTQASVVGSFAKEKLHHLLYSNKSNHGIIKLTVIVLIILSVLLLLKFIFKKYNNLKPVQKLRNIYNGVASGLKSVQHLQNKWQFILHSIFIWACYLAGTYIGFFAIKQTAELPVLAAFPVLVAGAIATMLTPGGMGAYPESVNQAMTLYNIPEGFGNANGLLQWSAQFLIIIVMGFLCLMVLPYLNKTKNEIGTSHT